MENVYYCIDAVWEKLFVLHSKHPALPVEEIHLLLCPERSFSFSPFYSKKMLSLALLLESKAILAFS